jgi:tricorn protease
MNAEALFMVSRESGPDAKSHLMAVKITNRNPKAEQVVEDIGSYEMSLDGKKLLVRKGTDLYVIDAKASKATLTDARVDLRGWTFPIDVRDDWRQIFVDAWRLERDYFYDPDMHGVDWDAQLAKYLPLVDRITTRDELSDLIGWFVGELSAVHTSVRAETPPATTTSASRPALSHQGSGAAVCSSTSTSPTRTIPTRCPRSRTPRSGSGPAT